jgi:hypothetical protein
MPVSFKSDMTPLRRVVAARYAADCYAVGSASMADVQLVSLRAEFVALKMA